MPVNYGRGREAGGASCLQYQCCEVLDEPFNVLNAVFVRSQKDNHKNFASAYTTVCPIQKYWELNALTLFLKTVDTQLGFTWFNQPNLNLNAYSYSNKLNRWLLNLKSYITEFVCWSTRCWSINTNLHKGEAKNVFVNTLSKNFQTFSQDTRNPQVSAYNHSFITVIQSYDCKQTSVGLLYSEKIDDVVLLNVFTKGFSASRL